MRQPGRSHYEIIQQQKRVARQARDFVRQFKTGKVCMDCGDSFPPEAMQFDHRDPATKKYNVASIVGPITMVLREIAKCDLICGNCHAIRTYQRIISGKDNVEEPQLMLSL